jgi:hypothetical protein
MTAETPMCYGCPARTAEQGKPGMGSRARLIGYGFLVWLVPFVVASIIIPTRLEWRELFESIMAVTLTTTVTVLAYDYLRRIGGAQTSAGLIAGIVWLAISVLIDLPFMLSSFVGMSLGEYLADIGLTYLLIPVVTTGMGMAFAHAARKAG